MANKRSQQDLSFLIGFRLESKRAGRPAASPQKKLLSMSTDMPPLN